MRPRITLDQWQALVSVVDAGGYAQAAQTLHKSQSAVSYAVQKIEQQLGVKAFVIDGRKARLTAAGEVLVRRGRNLITEAAALEQAAERLAQGWEEEIGIAMDVLFPTWLMLEALGRFGDARPHTRIELHESVIGGTTELLVGGRVDLALTPRVPQGFLGQEIMGVRMVCAAAPSHPLHALGRALGTDDLRAHRHLIVRDTGTQRTRGGGTLDTEQRWTVSSKATSIRAATSGHGFAWYAEDTIREELASGALRRLPLTEGNERTLPMYLVFADRETAGPGVRLLAEVLSDEVARRCEARVA